jgi:hypothetical protein
MIIENEDKVVFIKSTTDHPMSIGGKKVWVDEDGKYYGLCSDGVPPGYLQLESGVTYCVYHENKETGLCSHSLLAYKDPFEGQDNPE